MISVTRVCSVSSRLLRDRKSTRLNSSHSQISYAVFCLKKKKRGHHHAPRLFPHTPRLRDGRAPPPDPARIDSAGIDHRTSSARGTGTSPPQALSAPPH